MTEEEWLSLKDPEGIFALLTEVASQRKCILFCIGCCCFQARNRMTRPWRATEQFADGQITSEALAEIWYDGSSSMGTEAHFQSPPPLQPKLWARDWSRRDFGSSIKPSLSPDAVTQIIRCIFGNPFRPVTLDTSWVTSTVTTLARTMYETRDFSAMPILADALQDAGCSEDQVLSHCRGEGVHVRGCWLIDLLTGRT